MSDASMREFWDARAEEDAFFFVDNRLEYGKPELERFWAGGQELLEAMLGKLRVRIEPSDQVVEVGCGIGRMTRVLAEQAASVRAVDVSTRMIDAAKQLNPELDNVEWIVGDGHTLKEVEAASADAVHSFVVFQHLPDPRITLGYVTEIGRVLRPGGWAAFQVSNDPDLHRRRSLAERTITLLNGLAGRGPRGQTNPAWLGSAVDLDQLAATGTAAGLEIERVVGQGTQHCWVLMRRLSGPGLDQPG